MKECPSCFRCFPDDTANCPDDNHAVKLTLPVDCTIAKRYQIQKRIGHGSVSVVFAALDRAAGRSCAIKIIQPDIAGSAKLVDSFLRETAAIAALGHPNIVDVVDTGTVNGNLAFIVMELVKGTSLQKYLEMKGRLTPVGACELISPIAAALGAAHRLNFVHGDLKPRTILVETGRPLSEAIKVSDFGIARLKTGALAGPLASAKVTGVLRSPLYLAPEEWSDGEIDSRADIYSLGIILYQMLSGDLPFQGKSIPAIVKQHLLSEPPPIVGVSGRVPASVEQVVFHALQKEPADRPGTVDHFLAELVEALTTADHASQGPTQPIAITSNPEVLEAYRDPPADKPSPAPDFGVTLVNISYSASSVEDKDDDGFGQTVLIGNAAGKSSDGECYRQETSDSDYMAGDATLVLGADVNLFQDTIVPGSIESQPRVDTADNESVSRLESMDQPVDPVWPPPEIIAPRPDAGGFSQSGPDEMPQGISPMWLVVGVILVLMLIGAGIFYSRAA